MAEDQEVYDSEGGEFEKPKDEFLYYFKVFKIEEKKHYNHQKFDDISAQYWQLLTNDTDHDFLNNFIEYKVYQKFMRNVYKALLPIYRQDEMESEISQEWFMDSNGLTGLNYQQVTKLLFRIAHWFATNIDIDEYIDLLQRVYSRICVARMSYSYATYFYLPAITIGFPLEEQKLGEKEAKQKGGDMDDWIECKSDESNKSDYEYKYEEDPENMMVKKYKKMRNNFGNLGQNAQGTTIKEPLYYTEDLVFDPSYASYQRALADPNFVFPIGYWIENYLSELKNYTYDQIQQKKDFNKQEIARLKREMRENNNEIDLSQYAAIEDPKQFDENDSDFAVVQQTSNITKLVTSVDGTSSQYYWSSRVVSKKLTNQFCKMLRDGTQLSIRLYSKFPLPGAKTKSRSMLVAGDPVVELNKFGYNPVLERRVCFKLTTLHSEDGSEDKTKFSNVYHMLVHPTKDAHYRSDVNRVETKNKLAIKEQDENRKDEEFVNVETSYKKMRQIMLSKKFGSIFSDRSSMDNKEQKRLKKIIEKEDKRMLAVQKNQPLNQKGLSETYEDKSFLKLVKGPFYQLDSREGLKVDDLIYCADYDIIEAANKEAMRVLVIGKPRSGKTTLAKGLAQKLDLVHITVDNWIFQLLDKIKNYEPPELEEDQVAPKWLTDLEETINNQLKVGDGPSDEQVVEIIRQQIHSPLARTKGYILDLPYYQRGSSWTTTIRQQSLLGTTQSGQNVDFTHIVELNMEDDEIKYRAATIKIDPKDGQVYSKWEREERKKPKVVPEGEDPPDEDDENAIQPLDESSLVQRICDTEDRVKEELMYYNTIERPAIEELLLPLYDNQYVKFESAGLNPTELLQLTFARIKPDADLPLRPKAIQIENGSDFKGLLSEGQEENQIPRKWSFWKMTDPVALAEGKVVPGSPEFAASFHNNAFVFSSEENMKKFIEEPKKYLTREPQMPSSYRVLLLGPRGSGKHTQANKLWVTYGWKIVDFKDLIRQKLEEMRSMEIQPPNNPAPGGRIGLNEQELQEIIEGKSFHSWKFIPWIHDYLGFELEKRKPPPKEEKEGEENKEEEEEIPEDVKKKRALEEKKKREEEEKKRKEEEEIQRQKEERRRRRQEAIEQGLDLVELGLEHEEEEEIKLEDMPITELVLKVDEQTQKAPFVGGFIMVGLPETEEQFNKLKEHYIEFDKVIYLADTNEDEPGKDIKERMREHELFDYEQENEFSQKILAYVKEQVGDDNVKEISCNGPVEDVFIRIRKELDPFYLKIDNPDDVRVSGDLGDEDRPLPKGDFGNYCPMTYIKDKWLIRGTVDFEVTVNGKTYWMAGEKEQEEFKFDPKRFLLAQYGDAAFPYQVPPPKILVVGQKGSGVSTQIKMLCDKYKLDEFSLKDEFLKRLKEEKDVRKRRRLLDRGFKPPLPPDEEGMEPPPDPEIEDDPEDFDRAVHERDVLKQILDASKGLVIDGTWNDVGEELVSQSLQDLMFEGRRLPEIVIMLKCKEKSLLERPTIKTQIENIQNEFDSIMEKRRIERERKRGEDRQAKIDEVNAVLKQDDEGNDIPLSEEEKDEEMKKWDEERDAQEEADEESDPDKPNLDEMKERLMEGLRERREKDDAFMDEFGQAMKDKNVVVIDEIKSDISAEYVFIKLVERMKDSFQFRENVIERMMAQALKPEEVNFHEQSYNFKHSKFGLNSPISMSNPSKSKKYPVLYRERLYFLTDAQQQQDFLKQPAKYISDSITIPADIQIRPRIFVLGLSKTGKSTLCQTLVQRTGLVHLHITKIVQYFLDKDSIQSQYLRKIVQNNGQQLDDETLVTFLLKRIQFDDCFLNGFVLEDFPRTRSQALLLAKRGLVPSNVFYMKMQAYDSSAKDRPVDAFTTNAMVVAARNDTHLKNIPYLLAFYRKYYNNVTDIDAMKSKWFVNDSAFAQIQKNLQARQDFARNYYLRDFDPKPCKWKHLNMDRCLLKQSLSEFKYFCPVTWKNEKTLAHCAESFEDSVLYKNSFYFFKSTKERDMFIANAERFLANSHFPKRSDLPIRALPHKAAEITQFEKALNGHCAITILDEERVVKGDPLLLVSFKDARYVFESEFKLRKFYANPFKYSRSQLPVKMPPTEEKVNLYALSKMDDSITFMEQALGNIVTRALREVSENRLKYPKISVKETMLKLFALFLKANNPANTQFMKDKYAEKMRTFIQRCELPEEIFDLSQEKVKKRDVRGGWAIFKENYYNKLGAEFDKIITQVEQEKLENFMNYIR